MNLYENPLLSPCYYQILRQCFCCWFLESTRLPILLLPPSDRGDNHATNNGDYDYDVNGSNEAEHFLGEPEETPSASCNGVALAILDSSHAVAFPCADTDRGTNTAVITRGKRQRINCSGSGTGRQNQRLWTKRVEIDLLEEYLDYIRQNGWISSSLQNDVAFFYDQTRAKLNVDLTRTG